MVLLTNSTLLLIYLLLKVN